MASTPTTDSSFNSHDVKPVARRKSSDEDTELKMSEDHPGKSAVQVKEMSHDNSSSNDNNNDSDPKDNTLPLKIPEELLNEISEIVYKPETRTLKISFSKKYNSKSVYTFIDTKNWQKSIEVMEKKIKYNVKALDSLHYLQFENTIHENLDLILHADNLQPETQQEGENNQGKVNKIYLNKYVFEGRLYESIIVNRTSKFIVVNSSSSSSDNATGEPNENDEQYKLLDKLELENFVFYPRDTILSPNPTPYSFDSKEELNHYFELAKEETFDSLFLKILTEFKKYVANDEHVQTILAADILYSYFQDEFGTTHYNIFVGNNGSGKNSALLFFKLLGYRVFYVTAASAANYYTFLGEIQEGQGTIAEDEADGIGKDEDKQRILKTGYTKGGNVPKIEFINGQRNQRQFLTYGHKWLAMEELPDEENIKGLLDRSFIFRFLVGDVQYNIKDVVNEKDSPEYKQLIHIRKLLLVFKLLRFGDKFKDVKVNIKNRNAELTKPLLRLFYGKNAQEQIRKALSVFINEKSISKNNSLEAKLSEALSNLVDRDKDKEVYQFTNEEIFQELKIVMDGMDDRWDGSSSSFFTHDGERISKKKISLILKSKFKAIPDKIRIEGDTKKIMRISKDTVEKIGKQYQVIEEIQFIDDEQEPADDNHNGNCDCDTMTDVTLVEGATPNIDEKNKEESIATDKDDNNLSTTNNEIVVDQENIQDYNNSQIQDSINSNSSFINENNYKEFENKTNGQQQLLISYYIPSLDKENKIITTSNDKNISVTQNNHYNNIENSKDDNLKQGNEISKIFEKNIDTPLKSVTSGTSVADPPKYPCMFCSSYSTNIDFDMELHLHQYHEEQLLNLPIKGNLDKREEFVVAYIKRKMFETARAADKENK